MSEDVFRHKLEEPAFAQRLMGCTGARMEPWRQ
jgi:hypothetical protein